MRWCSHEHWRRTASWRVGSTLVVEDTCKDCGRVVRSYGDGNEARLSGRGSR